MENNCYICNVTLQNPFGHSVIFATIAVAATNEQASAIAVNSALEQFPPDWVATHSSGAPIATGILEDIAERVLGWSKPNTLSASQIAGS